MRPLALSWVSSGLQGCRRFQAPAVNYSTVLLEAEGGRLYVGARGAVFALNAANISASAALAVSCFCSHLGARSAPRRPILQSPNGVICISPGINNSVSSLSSLYSWGFSYFGSFKMRFSCPTFAWTHNCSMLRSYCAHLLHLFYAYRSNKACFFNINC